MPYDDRYFPEVNTADAIRRTELHLEECGYEARAQVHATLAVAMAIHELAVAVDRLVDGDRRSS